MQAKDRPASQAYVLLSLTALMWAGNAIAGKYAVGHVSPFLLTSLRWIVAAILLGAFAHRHVRRDMAQIAGNFWFLTAMGTLGFMLFNVMFYLALNYTTAINVAIEQAAMPLAVFALNFAIFGIRATRLQIAGFALTVAGVILTATRGNPFAGAHTSINIGDVLMVIAIMLYGAYSVALARKPALHWLSFLTVLALAAALTSLPLTWWEYSAGRMIWPTTQGWAVVLFTAIGPAIVAQLCWAMGLEIIGSNRGGVFINVVPIFTAVLAVALLGEEFQAYHATAMALVFSGVWLSQKQAAAKAA